MIKIDVILWGRAFKLPIEYNVYPGEAITMEMKSTAERLIMKHNFDLDLDAVKKYCYKTDPIATNGKLDNIFRFVIPRYVYVRNNKKHSVGLMCDFKFDPEHGIVLIYEDNKLVDIGPQDNIL